jgi:zinc transporter
MPEKTTLDARQGTTWIHADPSIPEDKDWLDNGANLDDEAKAVLQLPRRLSRRDHFEGVVLFTMCSVDASLPFDESRVLTNTLVIRDNEVISIGPREQPVVEGIRREVAAGDGPATPLHLLASMVVTHHKRVEPLIETLSEETDDLEDQVLVSVDSQPLNALDALRRKLFQVRRQLAAIENVLRLIVTDPTSRTSKSEEAALTAAGNFIARHIRSVVDCQDRAVLLYDKIESQLARKMARSTYDLTIIATVFLPLTFVTGLLGMNVSGIPESHDPWGFWIVVGVLVAVAVFAWVLMRRNRAMDTG